MTIKQIITVHYREKEYIFNHYLVIVMIIYKGPLNKS